MRLAAKLFGLIFTASACGGTPPPPQAPAKPRFMTIDVVGATIAPGKIDRTPWDGLGSIPEDVWRDLGKALLMIDPRAAVAQVVGRLANGTMDKPDVRAKVELQAGPYTVTHELPKVQDSFTPQWSPAASFAHIPVDPNLRIHITFTDTDLVNDDPIGVVVLTPDDLEQALALGTVCYIDVHRQSDAQVLFVHVAVRPE